QRGLRGPFLFVMPSFFGTTESQLSCAPMDQKIGPVVLVVDDEPLVLMDMVETLKAAGYQVWHAHRADEALRTIAAQSTPISALVTDIEMPGEIDGCSLAWRVA